MSDSAHNSHFSNPLFALFELFFESSRHVGYAPPVHINTARYVTKLVLHGYCYVFNENMDGKLLKKILGTHLKESAELHFEQDPPERRITTPRTSRIWCARGCSTTMEELQDVIAEVWEHTPPAFLCKLAHSMPERCQAVIDAKGDHTNY